MAVAMLPILLRARQPAYAWFRLRRQYPKPKGANPLPPSPRGWPLNPSFWPFVAFWAFILAFWAFALAFWTWLALDFELLGLGPGFCPGALLACGGSTPPGSLSLGARFPPGSLPIGGASNEEGGNLRACPKPKKVESWVACLPYGRVGGEEKMLAQILGQRIKR